MKIFIVGISGLLGLNASLQLSKWHQIAGCYSANPINIDGIEVFNVDITQDSPLDSILASTKPDLLINTVALTNVDFCEDNPGLAHKLNVESAKYIAELANSLQIKLVHISTDHVFDGENPWRSENDNTCPLNVYASTKILAEKQVSEICPESLIIRTNFFGWGPSNRQSFSDWIIQSIQNNKKLTMFTDVMFTPIITDELVNTIMKLVNINANGLFHVSGKDRISKYDFALCLAKVFEYKTDNIIPISVDDFKFKATRPKDMSLNTNKASKTIGNSLPSVIECLELLKKLEIEGRSLELKNARPK